MRNLSIIRIPAFLAVVVVGARGVVACAGTPPAPDAPSVAHEAASADKADSAPKSEAKAFDGGTEKWLAADGATMFEREITTKRSDADVQAVLHASTKTFRKCYQAALAKNPALAGRVNVKFTIDPDGKVSNAKDEGSTLASAGVINCIIIAFGKLKFPAVKDASTTIVYPLVLEPGN